jgi:acetyl esterase/lipase
VRVRITLLAAGAALLAAAVVAAADPANFDAAAAFGARPEVEALSLSPDGRVIAYIAPLPGQGTAVKTQLISQDSQARVAAYADGKEEHISGCAWVANDRLVCRIRGVSGSSSPIPFERLVAVNPDGSNLKLLNKAYRTGFQSSGGGAIVDWLSDESGMVLMSRTYIPQDALGSHIASTKQGLGVDRLDTRTLASGMVLPPSPGAMGYLSDQHGSIRVMQQSDIAGGTGTNTGKIRFFYRTKGSDKWQPLCAFNYVDREGFYPLAIDRDQDLVYGLKKKDGRMAAYSLALDGSLHESLLFACDDVDVASVIEIGRKHRVVGFSYTTDYAHAMYMDPAIKGLTGALSQALHSEGVRITDESVDEGKLLVYATSDLDPGTYYLYDRASQQLGTLLPVRAKLEGATLARVRPITFTARDGTTVPGYLTLPPGKTELRGLAALVIPHGGPAARDEWGFSWLVQYFAHQGYAVLQPNYRGSAGYGDAWFVQNGFKSWEIAIGDVLDGGRWLLAQGADPRQLAIVGWSYGGYAALQSVVVDQSVFKAAIGIAAVTDLPELEEQYRNWSNFYLQRDFIGTGSHVHEGSPAENAARIKVPVLLVQGTRDANVNLRQAELMDHALASAGVKHELIKYENLDHQLADSAARADMLKRSDAFLRAAFTH